MIVEYNVEDLTVLTAKFEHLNGCKLSSLKAKQIMCVS